MGCVNTMTLEQRIQIELEVCAVAVRSHRGDLEYVSFVNGVVTVQLKGACVGCPIVWYTVKEGILTHLQANIPEVIDVEWIN